MPTYDEVIEQSQANVRSLSEKLRELDELYQEIKALKEEASEIPDVFNKKFEELVNLSRDYTSNLGTAAGKYLDGSNTLFVANLGALSGNIKEFQKEISRLKATDFKALFTGLQTIFLDRTKTDLAIELEKFDQKSEDLQIRIDELRQNIERLEKIDLEKHFDRLQKTLADIFTAINGINLTFTGSLQTLTGIVQSQGTTQKTIDTNHQQVTGNIEQLDKKINSLVTENGLIKRELKTNRMILVAGLILIVAVLMYVAFKTGSGK